MNGGVLKQPEEYVESFLSGKASMPFFPVIRIAPRSIRRK